MAGRKISVAIVGDASSLEKAFDRAGKSAHGFGSSMRSLGKVAAIGVGGGVVGLTAILKTGFGELAEGQKVSAQTGAALKATGGVANVTAKQVGKLAESLSAMSETDDEAIQASENLLTLASSGVEPGSPGGGTRTPLGIRAPAHVRQPLDRRGREPV